MLSCRCLQMKWWAAVTVVAIPSQPWPYVSTDRQCYHFGPLALFCTADNLLNASCLFLLAGHWCNSCPRHPQTPPSPPRNLFVTTFPAWWTFLHPRLTQQEVERLVDVPLFFFKVFLNLQVFLNLSSSIHVPGRIAFWLFCSMHAVIQVSMMVLLVAHVALIANWEDSNICTSFSVVKNPESLKWSLTATARFAVVASICSGAKIFCGFPQIIDDCCSQIIDDCSSEPHWLRPHLVACPRNDLRRKPLDRGCTVSLDFFWQVLSPLYLVPSPPAYPCCRFLELFSSPQRAHVTFFVKRNKL